MHILFTVLSRYIYIYIILPVECLAEGIPHICFPKGVYARLRPNPKASQSVPAVNAQERRSHKEKERRKDKERHERDKVSSCGFAECSMLVVLSTTFDWQREIHTVCGRAKSVTPRPCRNRSESSRRKRRRSNGALQGMHPGAKPGAWRCVLSFSLTPFALVLKDWWDWAHIICIELCRDDMLDMQINMTNNYHQTQEFFFFIYINIDCKLCALTKDENIVYSTCQPLHWYSSIICTSHHKRRSYSYLSLIQLITIDLLPRIQFGWVLWISKKGALSEEFFMHDQALACFLLTLPRLL